MVERVGALRVSSAVANPIRHVVIIVKENHGFDNYFGTFHGAVGATMERSPNPPPYDPDHRHAAWLTRDRTAPRVQFKEADVPRYWEMATQYTLCDNYFTDVAGPSTPNHLMLVMADSPIVDNPHTDYRNNPGPPVYDQASLPAQLDAAGLTWANYNGYVFEFIKHTAGRKRPWQQFASDAARGNLPNVSWLYSDQPLSEHPADTAAEKEADAGDVTTGSQWTADQVQAVMTSPLWQSAVVFVTWDDWGGWWDHVTPPGLERWTDGTQFRLGGRVGCLVISPFAKRGYISRARHSHVSLVRFCEMTFGLPSLNARTSASDGMEDCFVFPQGAV